MDSWSRGQKGRRPEPYSLRACELLKDGRLKESFFDEDKLVVFDMHLGRRRGLRHCDTQLNPP